MSRYWFWINEENHVNRQLSRIFKNQKQLSLTSLGLSQDDTYTLADFVIILSENS